MFPVTLSTRNTCELSTKNTVYLDLKCLKAVHSQFSHWRFFKKYPSFCLVILPLVPSLHTHIFVNVVGFVLYKTILYIIKIDFLATLSHFTYKFECVCFFQSHKTTWTSSSVHRILSSLQRPSSISASHLQSMILLILRQFCWFAFHRNPSSISQGKSHSQKILSHFIRSHLSL